MGPLQVLHAPGHSPGHLAFYWPERRLLIAGDAIATWPDFSAGWKAFNLNKSQHAESLSLMAKLDPARWSGWDTVSQSQRAEAIAFMNWWNGAPATGDSIRAGDQIRTSPPHTTRQKYVVDGLPR